MTEQIEAVETRHHIEGCLKVDVDWDGERWVARDTNADGEPLDEAYTWRAACTIPHNTAGEEDECSTVQDQAEETAYPTAQELVVLLGDTFTPEEIIGVIAKLAGILGRKRS